MERTGAEFLNRLYKDMHMSDAVTYTASPSDKPSEKIEKYLDRMERIQERANQHSTETGIRLLKKYYYDHYIIKPENISDKYWQFLDSQYFDQYGMHMSESMKEQHLQTIIADQKSSLDSWIDYLSSEDARFYPTWAKYWAFQGMLKIGGYDNQKGMYKKRDKSTVAPFVELNREVLAKVVDMMIKVVDQEKIEETFQQLVENGNFQKLYTLLLKQNKEKVISNTGTEGIWKKYDMGSDYRPLWQSLQGKNTGWCTAGEDTCRGQIANGDFYVYYTHDEKGEATVPRLAIRMNGTTQIGEIRGIAKGQNIEPNFEEIVEEKLKDFPDRDKYKKRLHDTKMLTAVYKKYQAGEELTKEDLLFIYGNVEGCGWNPDSRLVELRKNSLQGASKELRNNPEVVMAAVQQDAWALKFASEELRNNPDVAMAAIRQGNGQHRYYLDNIWQFIGEKLTNNPVFMLQAVQQDPWALEYAGTEVCNNPEVVMAAVQQNGYALQYASEEVRNNPEVVKTAVQQNGYALQYASEEVRNNPEVVRIAVQKDGRVLQYASDELRSNPKVTMAAARQCNESWQYINEKATNDPFFMLQAVQEYGMALGHANEELRNNPEVVMAAVQQDAWALKFASEELRNNPEVVKTAVQQNGYALQYASEEVRNNPEVVKTAVQQNGYALQYASEEVRNNSEVVKAAVQQDGYALSYAGEEVCNNPEVVMAAVQHGDGGALEFASEELRDDPEIVMTAIKTFQKAFEEYRSEMPDEEIDTEEIDTPLFFASDKLKKDIPFVIEAIKECDWVLKNVDDNLKNNKNFILYAIHINPDVYLEERWQDDIDVKKALMYEKEHREKKDSKPKDTISNREYFDSKTSNSSNINVSSPKFADTDQIATKIVTDMSMGKIDEDWKPISPSKSNSVVSK